MQGICSHAANSRTELHPKNSSRKIDGKGINFPIFFQQSNIESRQHIKATNQKLNQNIFP